MGMSLFVPASKMACSICRCPVSSAIVLSCSQMTQFVMNCTVSHSCPMSRSMLEYSSWVTSVIWLSRS